jgi:hypothetical protein
MTPRDFRARFDRIDAFRERRIGIAIIEILVGTCLLLLYRGIIRPLSILMCTASDEETLGRAPPQYLDLRVAPPE